MPNQKKILVDAPGIERNAKLINLRFNRIERAITLEDADLIEDDAPAIGLREGTGRDEEESAQDLRKGTSFLRPVTP
ncbi:MAG: hypothetical protein ACUVV5_11900 [Candidatus Aminicenantales bacterium]